MIIGRTREVQHLEKLYSSQVAEFLVVYGRRRIGKTYLIRQFFQSKPCTFLQVTGLQKGAMKKQLAHFADSLSQTFMQNVSLQQPKSWEEAFRTLTQLIANINTPEKIVLFFDELPWLATPRAGVLEALDYYWNHHWSQNNQVILIVCGSSASWLIKNIIYNKGGLHNRCTAEIQLLPFTLTETKEFLQSRNIRLTDNHILDLYLALGGVPYYLTYVQRGLVAHQNIQAILCDEKAPLKDEYAKLFESLFTNAPAYRELMKLIASKKEGVSRKTLETEAKLSLGGGRLTDRLKQLEQTHFIKSYIPWEKERGEYYKVIDEFCLFYLYWLQGSKSKRLVEDFWMRQIQKPLYHVWAGYAFEAVCYKHIHSIIKALHLVTAEAISSWRSTKTSDLSGTQIDLLIERSDDAVMLCEIKYTEKPFSITKSYFDVLKNKIEVFKKTTKTNKQIFLMLISANGIQKNQYSSQIIDVIVTLEALFQNAG